MYEYTSVFVITYVGDRCSTIGSQIDVQDKGIYMIKYVACTKTLFWDNKLSH